MSSELRIALVGCGKISQKYADLLTAHTDQARLVAVCDQDLQRASQFGERHDIASFSSLEDMASAAELGIDVFIVLTPSGVHAANICQLARFGAKNIIVEKPIALAIEDAEQAIEACDASGTRLFVVKQWRFNSAVQALRAAYDAGRFGRISLVTTRLRWCRHQQYYDEARWRGTWAQDGGVLTNQACHAIDLLLWFGGEVESVVAMCQTNLAQIETEDTAVAIVRFVNGRLGAIEATTAVRPSNLEASFSVLGEGGSVELNGGSVNRVHAWRFERPEPVDEVVAQAAMGINEPPSAAHWAYLVDVFDAIRSGRDGGVSGGEALLSLRVIHALYESDRLGLPVDVRTCDLSQSRLGRETRPEAIAV